MGLLEVWYPGWHVDFLVIGFFGREQMILKGSDSDIVALVVWIYTCAVGWV
jgi:hypothetical protein